MDRERRQIGVLALEHDLLHRGGFAGDLDRRDRPRQALQDRRQEPAFVGPERQGKPGAAAHHIADQRRTFRPDALEQDRPPVAVEALGHPGKRNRVGNDVDFVLLDQPIDETAEAEPVEIDGGDGVGHRSHSPVNRARAILIPRVEEDQSARASLDTPLRAGSG